MYYFTFADRALGHDCVECGARCCKGLGFGMTPNEIVPFLTRAPTLGAFLQIQSAGAVAFDLAAGSWLLDGDGRCGLELDLGRDAKPAICRTFPLRIVRLGDTRVADLHLAICPLLPASQVTPSPGRIVLRHDELEEELTAL